MCQSEGRGACSAALKRRIGHHAQCAELTCGVPCNTYSSTARCRSGGSEHRSDPNASKASVARSTSRRQTEHRERLLAVQHLHTWLTFELYNVSTASQCPDQTLYPVYIAISSHTSRYRVVWTASVPDSKAQCISASTCQQHLANMTAYFLMACTGVLSGLSTVALL